MGTEIGHGRRVLVTGGAGFIGSHLVDHLLAEGYRVSVVDDLSTGKRENLDGQAALYPIDIQESRLAKVFDAERPEIVFHLAAQTSVVHSVSDPLEDACINILGSIHLLQQSRRASVRRVIYVSTGGALYGEPEYLPCDESHPVRPLAPYGASKFAVETYLPLLARNSFAYVVLRLANVYGPRQDPFGEAGVVAIFSRKMLDGAGVSVFGDGNQERDFVYVEDVVDSLIVAMGAGDGGSYNIATGTGTSINDLFHMLAGLTNYPLPPQYEAARPGEVTRIYLDGGKARRELSWSARTPLRDGLAATVKYFEKAPQTHHRPNSDTPPLRRPRRR